MENTNPDFRMIFESQPTLLMILNPDLTIAAATDAYLAATLTRRENIVGRSVFDVFPDNPDNEEKGSTTLRTSLERVLTTKNPDIMGILKYDIPREDGTFEVRYWSPSNTPHLDAEGNVKLIFNRVEDITDFIKIKEKGNEFEKLTAELQEQTKSMQSEIFRHVEQMELSNKKVQDANDQLNQANDFLEKTRQSLLLKTEELEQISAFKSEFLSNMSHELRTPLNSMLILSKLLSNNKDNNLTPKQVEQAKVIHKAGNDLLSLINDILDFNKIEAGKMEMEMDETSLQDIKNNIEGMFLPMAAEKQIAFVTKFGPGLPESFVSDQQRLEQVIRNLVSNAIKFTDEGGQVTFHVSKISRNTTAGAFDMLSFAVTDNGIGIAEDKQEYIFNAFQQADRGTSRKYGGTGLGLSISKQLIELLGGTISLQSAEGKGSTFTVTVPVAN